MSIKLEMMILKSTIKVYVEDTFAIIEISEKIKTWF